MIEQIISREPVNKLAAVVTGSGWKTPELAVNYKAIIHSKLPLPLRPRWSIDQFNNKDFHDYTGEVFGFFKVMGLHETLKSKWVVRCSCGAYETRTVKGLKHIASTGLNNRCRECVYIRKLRGRQVDKRTRCKF